MVLRRTLRQLTSVTDAWYVLDFPSPSFFYSRIIKWSAVLSCILRGVIIFYLLHYILTLVCIIFYLLHSSNNVLYSVKISEQAYTLVFLHRQFLDRAMWMNLSAELLGLVMREYAKKLQAISYNFEGRMQFSNSLIVCHYSWILFFLLDILLLFFFWMKNAVLQTDWVYI